MKKRLAILVLVMVLSLSGCVSFSSDTTYETKYITNGDDVELRAKDKNTAEIIARMEFGDAVSYIKDAKNGYSKVVYNGQTGYVLAIYLSSEMPVKEVLATEVMAVEETKQNVKALSGEEIEEYVKGTVRPIFYSINENLDNYEKYLGSNGDVISWYNGDDCVKREFAPGINSWDITRQYYYKDGEMIFAFAYEKGTEYRFYFKNNHLVRFIDTQGSVYNNPENGDAVYMAELIMEECY